MNVPPPKGPVPTLVRNGAPRPTQILVPQDNCIDLSQQYEGEGPRYVAHETKPEAHPTTSIGEQRVDTKYTMLEERLMAIEGFNVFGVDALEFF